MVLYAIGRDQPQQTGTQVTADNTPAAPGQQTKAPAGVQTVAGGQQISVTDGGSQLTVTASNINKKAKSSNRYQAPPVHGQFVSVQVEITAVKGSNDIGPSNFRMVGSDGTVYRAEFLVVGIEPQLDAMTEIQEGQKKSGLVVFDCDPAKLETGKVEFQDDLGRPKGYWTF